MTFKCLHCSQTFATPYALKYHISVNYQYIAEDEGETSYSNILYEEPDLWNDLPINEPKKDRKSETNEEIDNELTFPLSINPEDFHKTTLANATTDKIFQFFWKFDDFNIYEATVPDRMHMLDLGIMKLNNFEKQLGKCFEIYRQQLLQYNENVYEVASEIIYEYGIGRIAGFEEFLTENNITYDDKSGYFKIYSSVGVESTDIIRIAGNFYGNKWFSNIVVSSEEDNWYEKALLLLEFLTKKDKDPINLILLQWYDNIDEMYGCPRLWLTDQYTCVYLDSVDMTVHIIPRRNCKNEYFINRYIFSINNCIINYYCDNI
ncbi:hypothetical protein C1645_814296 [Glomus cerebriforme]|uniref:Uncharacterized protein n=1 Tax=Glomus cerebriforme TaxID=658196 RepID=A0A397TQS1_9GLOM|nr:hypothetical protein C1645_814296 [Glomus cerebriforme]